MAGKHYLGSRQALGFYPRSPIACGCASSASNRRSARTGRRPRKLNHRRLKCSPASSDADERPLRALRANRVFGTDEKRIRTENTVIDKNSRGLGFHTRSPLVCGCAFHPHASGDPRGRAAVRASLITVARSVRQPPPTSVRRHCALRAPTMFCVRIDNTSVHKTWLLLTARTVQEFYPRSSLAHGCASYPCASGDPRGRFFVRAKS